MRALLARYLIISSLVVTWRQRGSLIDRPDDRDRKRKRPPSLSQVLSKFGLMHPGDDVTVFVLYKPIKVIMGGLIPLAGSDLTVY